MTTNFVQANVAPNYQRSRLDWPLISIVATLLLLGLVMVFSASYPSAYAWQNEQPFYYASRQIVWMVIGVVAMIFTAYLPYKIWERVGVVLMGLTILSLLAVITLGAERFGATRTFFSGSVQPSEPAKIVIIAYISAWLASKGDRIRNVSVGLLPFSVLLGALTLLIMLQPSISTAILIVGTASIMFFIAGADLKQLALIAFGGSITFWLIVRYSSYAHDRMQKYLDSIWNPLASAEWQVQQTTGALTNGGLTGTGIAQGVGAQIHHVPLSWSDNIFAVIGEETGLVGALVITVLFALLAHRGLRIALRAPDNFGMLYATGITCLLILQALLNAAVVVAAVPPTGVTLPYMSYGGSSLVTLMAATGILLNIGRMGADSNLRKNVASRSTEKPKKSTTDQVRAAVFSGLFSYARINFWGRNRRTRVSSTGSGSTTRKSSATRASSAARSDKHSPDKHSTDKQSPDRHNPDKRSPARVSQPASKSTAAKSSGRREPTERSRSSLTRPATIATTRRYNSIRSGRGRD